MEVVIQDSRVAEVVTNDHQLRDISAPPSADTGKYIYYSVDLKRPAHISPSGIRGYGFYRGSLRLASQSGCITGEPSYHQAVIVGWDVL